MEYSNCKACEETHDNCDCKGFAVVVNDAMTDQEYIGIYKGFYGGLINIECEGLDMGFAPDACEMKREDDY